MLFVSFEKGLVMPITTLVVFVVFALPVSIGVCVMLWICERVFGSYHRLLNEDEPEEFRLTNMPRPPILSNPESSINEVILNVNQLE